MEIVVVSGILFVLSLMMVLAWGLVSTVSMRSAADNVMLAHVHLAGNWIAKDVERAKSVTIGPSGALCTMICYRWDAATENIADDTKIVYKFTTNADNIPVLTRQVDSNPAQQIAQYISSDNTTFTSLYPTENNTYKLDIWSVYKNFRLNKIYKASQRYPQ